MHSFIDTKHKSDDFKSNPSTSAYVFITIISDDSYFPKEVPDKTIKRYRSDYFNYYLLCNFYKAISPYFEDKTEKIISRNRSVTFKYLHVHFFQFYRKSRKKQKEKMKGREANKLFV